MIKLNLMIKPIPLSLTDAKAHILSILEDGDIKFSSHLRHERMKERSLTANDIRSALRNGEILRPAEWEEKYQNWKYRLEGKDLLGQDLSVITVIITKDLKLIIITAF